MTGIFHDNSSGLMLFDFSNTIMLMFIAFVRGVVKAVMSQ